VLLEDVDTLDDEGVEDVDADDWLEDWTTAVVVVTTAKLDDVDGLADDVAAGVVVEV